MAAVGPSALTSQSLAPPTYSTRFIDQQGRLRSLQLVCRPGALITVIGPPGIGKTRLAAEVADRLSTDGAIVNWLTVREGDDPIRMVAALETGRPSVVVLDDADLALRASMGVARHLRTVCHGVTVLATSRQRLGLDGEQLFPATGVRVPNPHRTGSSGYDPKPDLDRLRAQESVCLFVDRAELSMPGFELDLANAAAVVDLCRWLDGLPLAIELAAQRLRQTTVVDLVGALADLLDRRDESAVGRPSRHRSLEAAIGWSYQRLSEDQRAVMAGLGTFRGTFSGRDAAAVAAAGRISSADVEAVVRDLLDRSLLVRAIGSDGGDAYRLPHPIRAYALRELARLPDRAEAEDRHASWARREAASLGDPRTEEEWACLARLAPELLASGTSLSGEAVNVLMFGCLDVPLSDRSPATTAEALRVLGIQARVAGDYGQASAHLRRAFDVAANQGDERSRAGILLDLAENAYGQRRYDRAQEIASLAGGLYRTLNDRGGTIEVKHLLGKVCLARSDAVAAERLFEEGLRLAREETDRRREACALLNLALVDCELRRIASARLRLVKSLALRRRMQNDRGVARVIEAFALVESIVGNHRVTLQLLGAARQYRRSSGALGIPAYWRQLLQEVEYRARKALAATPHEVECLLERGAACSLEGAADLAVPDLGAGPPDVLGDPVAAPLRRRLPNGVAAPTCGPQILAMGEPNGTRVDHLLSFAMDPSVHRGVIVPVFSGSSALADVLALRPRWAEKPVLSLSEGELRSSLLMGETVVVDPWLASERRYEPASGPPTSI
jgi:predicted ATPase